MLLNTMDEGKSLKRADTYLFPHICAKSTEGISSDIIGSKHYLNLGCESNLHASGATIVFLRKMLLHSFFTWVLNQWLLSGLLSHEIKIWNVLGLTLFIYKSCRQSVVFLTAVESKQNGHFPNQQSLVYLYNEFRTWETVSVSLQNHCHNSVSCLSHTNSHISIKHAFNDLILSELRLHRPHHLF